MGRARVPARREGVLEANGVFSPLIRQGFGLRERRIARTRSLPALGPAAAGPLPRASLSFRALTAFPPFAMFLPLAVHDLPFISWTLSPCS
jgi:hypothetical protein